MRRSATVQSISEPNNAKHHAPVFGGIHLYKKKKGKEAKAKKKNARAHVHARGAKRTPPLHSFFGFLRCAPFLYCKINPNAFIYAKFQNYAPLWYNLSKRRFRLILVPFWVLYRVCFFRFCLVNKAFCLVNTPRPYIIYIKKHSY